MCGLGGIIRMIDPSLASAHTPIPEPWLDVLDGAVSHRGPDGGGRFRDHFVRPDGGVIEVALVHRRLSIIDLADGAQPMVRTVGGRRLAVAFNGCIYNHRALRAELVRLGQPFESSHSDTEVILAGWLEWGSGVFQRLNGMFGILLWDGRSGTFVAARDPFGEKPLYGVMGASASAFANVPRALERLRPMLPGYPRAAVEHASIEAANTLYFGAVPWVDSFQGIAQAQPGGAYSNAPGARQAGEPLFAALWRVCSHPAAGHRSAKRLSKSEGTADSIEEMLESSVRERLEADVPVAALLSGGVDSSLVCAVARRHKPDLLTLCVKMPDDRYDESGYARQVAEHLGLRHETVTAGARPVDDLVHLVELLGQPFGDSSLLPTFWACRAARDHAKVLLTGDGGDEVFLGYDRYRAIHLLRWMRFVSPMLWLLPKAGLREIDPKSGVARFARLIEAAKGRGYADLVAVFPIRDLVKLVSERIARRAGTDRDCGSELYWDLFEHFPDVLLRKVDHAAMVAGVEVRCPFLDHRLAEVALRLPVSVVCPLGERKGLLRAIARRHLPPAIVDRPKQGFAIPIGEWFRNNFGGLRDLLGDVLGTADPFPKAKLGVEIDLSAARQMVAEHLEGRRDHSQRLFMLLTTALWCRSAV